ncbi:MAG: AN1-type zinc finger domain-containing protein [Nitrososphaeraceae archaeon]
MKCHRCGLEESIPFRCNYCGESFCYLHRIPINHSCPFLDKYTQKKDLMMRGNYNTSSSSSVSSASVSNSPLGSLLRALKIKTSKTELLHLSVATLLITAVGLSLNSYRHISWQFLAIFISAFLIHEFAHKFLAQYYGSWAEFRTQTYGLIVTAISAIPFIPFKFIAPGAVMVGLSDKSKFGRVALIGPLTNLVMGFGFLISTYLYPYHPYFYAGASFNAWIAMFNLLPFGVLDGQKIFDWNKIAWGCAMAITMVLFIVAYL